jgi:hypothetical protein
MHSRASWDHLITSQHTCVTACPAQYGQQTTQGICSASAPPGASLAYTATPKVQVPSWMYLPANHWCSCLPSWCSNSTVRGNQLEAAKCTTCAVRELSSGYLDLRCPCCTCAAAPSLLVHWAPVLPPHLLRHPGRLLTCTRQSRGHKAAGPPHPQGRPPNKGVPCAGRLQYRPCFSSPPPILCMVAVGLWHPPGVTHLSSPHLGLLSQPRCVHTCCFTGMCHGLLPAPWPCCHTGSMP